MSDILYTFGVEYPGALTLNNYPSSLMNLKIPKHQQTGEEVSNALATEGSKSIIVTSTHPIDL